MLQYSDMCTYGMAGCIKYCFMTNGCTVTYTYHVGSSHDCEVATPWKRHTAEERRGVWSMLEEGRSIRVIMMYLLHCWGLVGCISSYRERKERKRERESYRYSHSHTCQVIYIPISFVVGAKLILGYSNI